MNLGALDETSKAPTKQYYPRNISQENRKDTKKEEKDHDELKEGQEGVRPAKTTCEKVGERGAHDCPISLFLICNALGRPPVAQIPYNSIKSL